MNTYIVVTNSYEGIHRYKDAPDKVGFLRDYHRHIFNIRTQIEVFNDDRELEFILVKREIDNYFRDKKDNYGTYHMGDQSCEMIAINLIKHLKSLYGDNRKITVSVFEDNENGAIVEGEI